MGERATPELLPGTLYMLILRTLNGGPLHGYAIARRVKDASQESLTIEDGSLYPALNRMILKGWLKAEWGTSENGRQAKFYKLSPKGQKQLESEQSNWNRLAGAVASILQTEPAQ